MIRSIAFCINRRLLFTAFYVLVSTAFSFAQNAIVTENANAGNPISEWGVPDFRDNRIAGFATKMSLNRGQTVRFKIDVQSGAAYSIKIYRIGYYGGNGGRLMQNLGTFSGTVQPNGITNSTTGLLDCGNWSESASWAIPSNAVSGLYIAKLERTGGGSNHIVFIVRDDASTSNLYFQIPDATWQAYNGYGGTSIYDGTTSWPSGHAVKVSYNRPFFPYNSLFNTDGREADWYMNSEYPMIRWLERNGYDVTYTSCNDVDNNGGRLLNHKIFISNGHDEYWSKNQRNNVEAARNAGVSLAFFSGNEVYWKTRWENNDGTEDRTLVCYKEGTMADGTLNERSCGSKCDASSSEWTGLWKMGANYDAGKPENALTGQISWVEYPSQIEVPDFYKKLRFWRNSAVANLSAGQTAVLGVNTLGYEWDYEQTAFASSNAPGRITMSSKTVNSLTHKLSLYRHSSGALVFGAGTVQWSWGLDGSHWGASTTVSPEMQQATVNLFADMGVQPGTLQSGLSSASQSTDATLPTSSITSPSNGFSVAVGASVTFSGTATDPGAGVVAAVEISTDGGITWSQATLSAIGNNITWSYTWTAGSNGSYAILARGVDDSGNIGTAAGISIIVGTGDTTPPTVSSVSPTNGSLGVSANTIITANFSESVNSSTVNGTTFQLKDAGNNVITSSVSTSANQITLTPSSALTSSATYIVTIKGGVSGVKDLAGNPLVNDYSWSFTTAASGAGGTIFTVFQTTGVPTVPKLNDDQGIEVGMRFRSTQNGFITGIRYYKGSSTTGTHTGSLWNNAGTTRLGQATFTNETASGWQQVLFSTPVAITAGVSYVVSYFSPSGDYYVTKPYFTQNVTNGPLIGLADGTDGANGLYRYTTTSAFPNSSFQSSNYWVDVLFSMGGPGGVAPTVTTHPASQSVCAGSNVSFNSSADGTPSPTVQWQVSTDGTSWSNITGATNGTLTFAATTGDNNKQYRAVWTNSTSAVNSNPATLTVKAIPSAPGVTVVNNCGTSMLTAGSYTGDLMWSNGAITSSITVTTAGTYSVTQTVNGCTSPSGSGVAAPKAIPSAPVVTVVNNCGSSILTATSFTGSLLWSNGATTSSITVATAGTYTVTQTMNGCTSPSGSGVAAPLTSTVTAPTVSVVNNCGTSTLTAGSYTGSLLWSNGATTSSITVAAGTYTVTQTVNGCTSPSRSGVATPKAIPSTLNVTVVNNCGSSVLSTSGYSGPLLWSNGAATSAITVTTAGTYTVTQTVNGCTSLPGSGVAAPKVIPSAPVVTVVNNCGSSTLTATSFTGSLLWSNGATTSSITVTTAGTYTVKQTVNGCTSSLGSGVAAPVTSTVTTPTVSVVNNCGTSTLTAGSYTGSLLWSNGATTSSITVATAGTYTVTQTVNGCTSPSRSGVAAPKAIPSAPTVSVVDNCGSSILTATSFTGSLLWSNGATTSSITVTTAGTYTVTQTVNGCASPSGSGVAAPQAIPSAPTVSVVDNCGSSTLTAGSFTGSLLWNNGATTSSITVTTAGTYTVTQTVNGCASPSGSGVAAPQAIPSAPTVSVVDNCGSSTLTAGSFNGSLLWSNGATTSSVTVTTAGTYTVTQTVNGCTSLSGSGVAAPQAIPLAPTVSVVDNCGSSTLTATSFTGSLLWSNGATTSSITVTTAGTYSVTQMVNGCTSPSGSGAAAPKAIPVAPTVSVVDNCGNSILTATSYTGSLLWSNGATTSLITVTTAGTYSVTQTVNGCTSPSGSGVAAPKAIPSAPVVTVVNNCGSSILTATSFTGSLLWSNGATTSSITVTTAGTYSVTQTVNGCTSPSGSGVAAPLTSTVTAPTVSVVNNCGSSTLTAGSYTGSLLWSNGATTSSITVAAGTYTVTQTVNGCTSPSRSGVATPKAIPSTLNVTVVNNCGSSVLSTSGYSGPLLWSTGAATSAITVTTAGTYSVTQTVNGCTSVPGSGVAALKVIPSAPVVTVVNNCGSSTLTAGSFTGSLLWNNGATTSSITVTTAGTYTVKQTVNGCTSPLGSGVAAPVTSTVTAPTVSVVNNCGTSTLTAGSYTGSLLWSNGATTSSITVATAGTYTVTQTVNGCTSPSRSGVAAPKAIPSAPTVSVVDNCGSSTLTAGSFTGSLLWSNGATTSSITVITAGTYTVTQTVTGCTSLPGSGVAAPKLIPAAPVVTVENNCGSSTLTADSFTGSLLWSNGATTSSITVTTAGTYTVTQTVNGCTSPLGSGVAAPLNSNISAPVVSVVDNCGSSTLTATSFTGSLLWSNGATTSSITVTTAGTYTVTQTVNGCTSPSGSGVAAPKEIPSAPTVSVVDNCGSTTLTAGSFSGSLLWSNGATTSSITVTTAGTYTVTQMVNGCTSPSGSGVAAPKEIPSAPTVSVVDNCGNSILTATSYTGSLLWSNGATTSSITVTTAGTYSVTQTVNGCTSPSGSGVAAPKAIPSAPVVTVVNNCGSSILTATSFAGSLLWSNGATTSSITVTTAGTYTVTQTVNGCTSSSGSGVAAPKAIPSAPTVSVHDNCGSSVLTAGSFTGSLLWSNGATTSSITVTTAGTYTVTQTVNECTSSSGSGVASPLNSNISAPTVSVVDNCGTSTLTANSYTGSLLWSTGATTSSITVTTAGTYTVTQTVNGCTSSSGSGVAAPLNSNVSVPTVSVVNNCGTSTLTAGSYTGSLLWSNGATTSSITVATAGTYTVAQTVNGCASPSGTGVAAPQAIPSAPIVSVVDNCGSTTLTAGSFTGSLLWSDGATTSSITVTTAGTYSVTQMVNGCTSPSGSGAAAPKAIPVAPTVSVVDNCGNSILTATSYTGSLLWSNGATTSLITVTTAGTYSVTQTVNGCTSPSGSGVAAPKAIPSAPVVTVVNNCGSSILTATSITGSLLWSNGATTSSITVTTAGTYSVTQTVNGCTSPSGSGVAAPLTSTVTAPTVSVVNNCGSSTLTAGSYTGSLLWSNGATTSSITVAAGTYTVTQTVNGCTSPSRSGVATPKAIPSTLNVTVVNNCGSSVLSTSGYSGPLLWSTGAATSAITVTTAGTYSVTQTVNGCTSVPGSGVAAPKVIPSAPVVTVVNNCGSSTLTAGSFTGSLLWNNGATTSSITVTTAGTYTVKQTVNGCTSPLGSGVAAPVTSTVTAPTVSVVNNCGTSTLTAGSYTGSLLWSNGATTSSITVATAGTYTVTQTVNGCTSPSRSGVAAPKAIPSAPTVSVVDNCGSSTLTAGSFTGSLLWSNGATTSSITVITAGTYTVTQTVTGCTSLPGSGVAAPKLIPAAPVVTVENNCGSSTLTADSFTGSLLWSNGATTSSITVTTAGTYTVTQTVNGCTSSSGSGAAAPLNSNISAPVVSVVDNCGSSTLTATSFTGSLLWSNGATTSSITVTTAGTYTVTQTVNGCTSPSGSGVAAPKEIPSAPTVSVVDNCGSTTLTAGSFSGSLLWSNGATTSSITVTTAGTYTVTQMVNGCTSPSGSGIAAPQAIPSAPVVTMVDNCGSSTLTATSFTGSLLWSNGATTSSITVTTAGTYTVTQTVNGCASPSGTGVAAPKEIPSAPTVSVVDNCGISTLTASSFAGTLLWSNGATTSSIVLETGGTYTVTQTINGCVSPSGSGASAPKEIPSAPTVSVHDNCGSSVLTAGSFTGSLLWSNGATTSSITVTTAGTYTVTQTVNECTSSSGSGVASPITLSVPAPAVSVVDDCGSSTLTAGSFTGSLLWNNGATTSSITVTTPGTYSVTQIVNGCTSPSGNGVATPKSIPALTSNLTATIATGTAFAYTPTSTETGTTLTWSRAAVTGISNAGASGNGDIHETLNNISTAAVNVTYVYTLTANGCTNTQNVVVTVNPVALTVNCVINSSITQNFNSTEIPAGRFIWFNSSFSTGSLGTGTAPVTITVTNTRVSFTANSEQYLLDVPDARIRFDALATVASTEFVNNVWETTVPRGFTDYIFMNGLSYNVPVNFPENISNVVWTANISIDKTGITLDRRWSAAVYTSFAANAGVNVKPITSNLLDPYLNSDDAGTPENFKSFVVSGAKGSGGTNYTGTFTTTQTSTCAVPPVGTRGINSLTTTDVVTRKKPDISKLLDEQLSDGKLNVQVFPNPSSNYFNLVIKGNPVSPVTVRVLDISGRVVEKYEKIASTTVLKLGYRLRSGSYFAEVIQGGERKVVKMIMAR